MKKAGSELQHSIIDELEWDPRVDATQIGVTVSDGVVTLTGRTASYAERSVAEEVAKRVTGVEGIANEIEVHPAGSAVRTDSDIASAAVHALKWDSLVPDDKIQVSVRNGWITLEGKVDWAFEREAAYRAVKGLTGVKGINSMISLTPRISPTDVRRKIVEAFHRNAQIDANQVEVQTKGSTVILKGKVRSWAERQEAEHVAWLAPGVSAVENSIRVTQ